MKRKLCRSFLLLGMLFQAGLSFGQKANMAKPNVILIYTDDLGYGDISCYGSSAIATPHIDSLAKNGVRYTNAHATSATCTPSRFSLLTGKYAWRKEGTGIAPGDAALIIPANKNTLPGMMQRAGYHTAVIGKWHLGLGDAGGVNWNGKISPGPRELGFDYSFIIPATGDRVPCVFVENQEVVNLDKNDPIQVSYKNPIDPNDPTGKKNPELLKLLPSHGHDNSIVNGVSRIGYMKGGKTALWRDEDFADILMGKARSFITGERTHPFFLYFATHDIHVPRLPNERFIGKSGLGPRGDAILELDWTVGQLMDLLRKEHLLENTLIIFTSDNGYVVDDGYQDDAEKKLGNHKPGGVYRGGKYSAFEAGTRVPFITSWKGKIKGGVTNTAMFSQIDLFASLAKLVRVPLGDSMAPDSKDNLPVLLNKSNTSRKFVVEQSLNSTLSLITGNWKYIEPSNGPKINKDTKTELGNFPGPQLYDLSTDPGETKNLADTYPEKVKEMKAMLDNIKKQ